MSMISGGRGMLKEIDGKIVVPKRFMEWLAETEVFKNQSFRIALINRTGWGFCLETDLRYGNGHYKDLTNFVSINVVQLTRALLDKKEFISEEEIKYYMMTPDGFDKRLRYLKLNTNKNEYYVGDKNEHYGPFKTQFTQSEIDAMPQKYRGFFTQVEVEE